MKPAFSSAEVEATTSRRGLMASGWAMVVVAVSVVAWLGALVLMGGMDEGPGTPLERFPSFLVAWIVMLTAMMLPSELNYLGSFAVVTKSRETKPALRRLLMLSFVAGYAVAWMTYGVLAYLLDGAIRAISPDFIAWDRAGPYLAGAVLIAAGTYQISHLKHACLSGCRSPLSFFSRYWRRGASGALRMGVRHGLVCVGCCWALMAVMFAVGAMSLTWMGLLTLIMFAEKVLPHGRKLTLPIASFLWIMGAWIALSPGTAPLLKNPLLFASTCGVI
jgi:predicted metal-binding membrane protein